jgi:hypothetical protein
LVVLLNAAAAAAVLSGVDETLLLYCMLGMLDKGGTTSGFGADNGGGGRRVLSWKLVLSPAGVYSTRSVYECERLVYV